MNRGAIGRLQVGPTGGGGGWATAQRARARGERGRRLRGEGVTGPCRARPPSGPEAGKGGAPSWPRGTGPRRGGEGERGGK
jgi:hypothetical protein